MKHLLPAVLAVAVCGSAFAQAPDDLLISEYVEGSSFNKAVELYNGTGSAIDLGAERYYLRFYFNGNATAGTSIALMGTVADGDVFVLAEDSADPAILAEADQLSGASFFNGDDAVVLFRDSTMIVDAIGQVGFDPGDEWGMGDTSTQNNTLRRVDDSCDADADTSDAFDPAENYVGFPIDTFDGLGSTDLDCEDGMGPNFELMASASQTTVARGGSIVFSYSITNNTTNSVTGDLFFMVRRGGNPVTGRTVRSGTLPPGFTLNGSYTQSIPMNAPLGPYDYDLKIGQAPNTVVDIESFVITVTPAAPSGPAATAWSVTDATPWIVEGAEVSAAARVATVGAYPNPFARSTEIGFELDRAADVSLVVYDVRGRAVATLAEGAMEAGQHSLSFDAASLPSGVYVYRLTAGTTVETGRVTLVR